IRRKGLWLSIRSIFAPTEVAASLALIVLVAVFTLVYFGARHSGSTHPTLVTAIDTPTPPISPSPSAPRDPVATPTPNGGLGTVIRAVVATTHQRATVTTAPAPVLPSPWPTDSAIPTPTPTDSPTPTPSPTDTSTPTPTPTPTDTPTPTPAPSPS